MEAMSRCIEWAKSRLEQGYGQQWYNGRRELAHRVAYVLANGLTIADIRGQDVLHSCDNPPCINSEHLSLGTRAENNAQRHARGRDAIGTANGNSKFSDETIERVFQMRAQGMLLRQIGTALGMDPSYAGRVLKHRKRNRRP